MLGVPRNSISLLQLHLLPTTTKGELACESSLTPSNTFACTCACLSHALTGPLSYLLAGVHRYRPDDDPPETEAEADVFARRAHNLEQVNATDT